MSTQRSLHASWFEELKSSCLGTSCSSLVHLREKSTGNDNFKQPLLPLSSAQCPSKIVFSSTNWCAQKLLIMAVMAGDTAKVKLSYSLRSSSIRTGLYISLWSLCWLTLFPTLSFPNCVKPYASSSIALHFFLIITLYLKFGLRSEFLQTRQLGCLTKSTTYLRCKNRPNRYKTKHKIHCRNE